MWIVFGRKGAVTLRPDPNDAIEPVPRLDEAGTTPAGDVSTTPFRPGEPLAVMRPARILVAETHPLTRFGIRRALEEQGFSVCAEADDAAAAIDAALHQRPDVCLLDAELEGGVQDAIREIASELPDAAVVVLTDTRDDRVLVDALCAGASGSVQKDVDPKHLALTLQVVLEGDVPLPRSVVAALLEPSRATAREGSVVSDGRPGRTALTRREREVLRLLREGRTTAEVAAQLFISKVTVRSHICAIVRKLGVADRQAAIRRLSGEIAFRKDAED